MKNSIAQTLGGFSLIFLLTAAGTTSAETRYVTDQITVSLRSVPSDSEYEVVDKIRSGDAVDVLQDKGGYSQIKTKKGSEGWVRSHYLMTRVPEGDGGTPPAEAEKLKERIRELEAALSSRKGLSATDVAAAGSGTAASSAVGEDTAGQAGELAEIKEKYTRLLEQSKDVVALTQERNELRADLATLRTEVDYLRVEKERMHRSGLIRWFIAGAGVLLAGWLIGRASRKAKRFY